MWLPRNKAAFTWKTIGDVPTDMWGQLDLVHVGIFLARPYSARIIQRSKMLLSVYSACLSRSIPLTSQIEPGGFLHWDELDWAVTRLAKRDPSLMPYNPQKLFGYAVRWYQVLDSTL